MNRAGHIPIGLAAGVTLLSVVIGTPATAEDRIPHDLRAALLVKLLDYERGFRSRVRGRAVVLLAYRPGDPDSRTDCRSMARALLPMSGRDVHGIPLHTEMWATTDGATAEALRRKLTGSAAVYVCSGISPNAGLAAAATGAGTISFVQGKNRVASGYTAGIDSKDNRPRLFINLKAIRKASIQLDARVLALAQKL